MSYNYNVDVTLYTGFFRKREVGHFLMKDVSFKNPIQKGDGVTVDAESYRAKLNEAGPSRVYMGVTVGVGHTGMIGEASSASSTLYVEYRDRSEFGAEIQSEILGRLEKLIERSRESNLAQTAQ